VTRSARLTTGSLALSWGSPRDLIAVSWIRLLAAQPGRFGFLNDIGPTATPSLTASSRLGSRIGCARDAAQSVHSKLNVECPRATIIAANAVPPGRRLPLLLLVPGGAAKVVMQQVRRTSRTDQPGHTVAAAHSDSGLRLRD
jgi:hypothetical protein